MKNESINQSEREVVLNILKEVEQIPQEYLQVVLGIVQAFRQNLPTKNGIQENEIIKYKEKDNYTFEDIKEIADQFPSNYKWTYQDLINHFPSDLLVKVEIINNQIFVMPSPEQDPHLAQGCYLVSIILSAYADEITSTR